MLGLPESFKYRVHFAARDGMAIILFALLSEKTSDEVQEVLNEVSNAKYIFINFFVWGMA